MKKGTVLLFLFLSLGVKSQTVDRFKILQNKIDSILSYPSNSIENISLSKASSDECIAYKKYKNNFFDILLLTSEKEVSFEIVL